MSLPLQDVLGGKYEILEKIGEGGIGAVYKVKHRLLEEVRVIKVLRPQAAAKQDLQERFLQEARMAIRLKHPNIAQLHDFSIAEDDRAYIVMEFIDGIALDAMLAASGPPSVELTLEISRQALAALDYLHEHEFVHRDVSPDNLMLTTGFDGAPMVKLIDLGIAKHLGDEAGLTATGVFLGKARYCSPEQFSAGGETEVVVDRRADIYSYGVMLYELLTGTHPLRGDSFAELAGSHLFQPPRPFEETDPEGRLPEGLREAVLKALAKEPDERFASAAEFAAELAQYSDPAHSFQEEFNHTVELTTSSLPRLQEQPRESGSTQNRLDEQFGMGKTPSPATAAAMAKAGETAVVGPAASIEAAAGKVEELLARGRLRPAGKLLARAIAAHGEAAPLLDLRRRLEAAAQAAPPRSPLVPVLVVVAAATVIGLGVALWQGWLGGAGPPAPVVPEPAGEPVLIAATPRWNPAARAGEGPSAVGFTGSPPPLEPAASASAAPPPAPGPSASKPVTPSGGVQGGTQQQPPPLPAPPPEPQYEVTQETFEPGVGVVPPVLVSIPPTVAPDDARRLREELQIVVEVLVDETGKVLTARAEAPAFRGKYRDAAIEIATAARFRPARRGNTLGRMWTEIHLTFKPE